MAACVIPTAFADLAPLIATAVPITYTGLNNVTNNSGILTRSGGTPNTSDAYAYSANWVEGTGCAYWELRHFFNDDDSNNLLYYVIEDEFGTANRYGWYFQNGIASFRRSPFHGTTADFPVYYGPAGGPASPNQVGYNVGFRFGIYFNNGTVRLYENVQFTNSTNTVIEPVSYTYAGLPTDRRWRLKVYVFPSAATAHSSQVIEAFGGSSSPSLSPSSSASASPSATPSSSASPSPGLPCTPPEGSALSCVNAGGQLLVTLINQDNEQIAYAWHEGSERMPITSMTNWKGSLRPLTLLELDVAFETDDADADRPMVVSVHRNLRKNYVRDARVTNGSNRVDSLTAGFDSDMVAEGMMIAVFGHNVGGPGVDHIIGYMATASSPSASLSPSVSTSASPSTSVSASPSLSPSLSPSSSRSSSASPSHSPSASPSASPSRSPSASPSITPSASPSASPSSTPSTSVSASPSSSGSVSPSLSPSLSPSASPSAS